MHVLVEYDLSRLPDHSSRSNPHPDHALAVCGLPRLDALRHLLLPPLSDGSRRILPTTQALRLSHRIVLPPRYEFSISTPRSASARPRLHATARVRLFV